MSTVVQVLCVPHDPTLPRMAAAGANAPEPLQRTIAHFETLRARLAAAEPDVLVVVSGDHLNQWFYDNMPTFSIGKAIRAAGPFPHEQELFAVGSYDTALERDVADLLESHPGDLRIAVIASGHLSNAIGGPNMADLVRPDNPWDLRTWEQITGDDIPALVEQSTYENLSAAGHGTLGFLDYIFAMGAVGGRRPDFAEKVASTAGPPTGFLAWDPSTTAAEATR